MYGKPDWDAERRKKEPAKRSLDHDGKPDWDAKPRYKEPAERRLDRRSASQVSSWGGEHAGAPQKEKRVRWCIARNVHAIRPRLSPTCLHTQCTASTQSPVRQTVAVSLCGHHVPIIIINLCARESHDHCHIALRPARPHY